MTRFLVYTQPSAGHVFPLVPGLTALAARGTTCTSAPASR
jgi:hypothetical protein